MLTAFGVFSGCNGYGKWYYARKPTTVSLHSYRKGELFSGECVAVCV